MANQTFVGIDVGKSNLDVNLHGNQAVKRFSNSPTGIQKLEYFLREQIEPLVVMEASGGYESLVAKTLRQAGFPVCVVNPTLVRRFAQGMGTMAKTDAIDARIIARYASIKQPKPQAARGEDEERLVALMDRREQLNEMVVMEKNRLSTAPILIRESIQLHIEMLKQQIKQIDQVVDELIAANQDWQNKIKILTSFKGVGTVVAVTLLAELPELGQESRERIGALAGLAPINQDSGTRSRKRKTLGGRAKIRRVLFMVALGGIRYNPVIKEYYERLLNRGKEKKVALVACMHKILTILNALLRKEQLWLPDYA